MPHLLERHKVLLHKLVMAIDCFLNAFLECFELQEDCHVEVGEVLNVALICRIFGDLA